MAAPNIAFKAPWYFSGEHLQTIVNAIRPVNNELAKSEKNIVFKLDVDNSILIKINEVSSSGKAILFLHGLEGSSESRYILRNAPAFYHDGYSVFRMNMRNCNSTENLCKTLYNAGMYEDVKRLLSSELFALYTEIILVGFSLGANLLGRFCGMESDQIDSRVKFVFLVSPPLDLFATSKKIMRPQNYFYNRMFTKSLVAKVRLKAKIFPELFDATVLGKVSDLLSFDDYVTAPNFGYKDAEDYYKAVSCINCIENSAVPIRIIHSRGDPIIDFAAFDFLIRKKIPNISFEIVQNAGHVGFYGLHHGKKQNKNIWLYSYIAKCLSDY